MVRGNGGGKVAVSHSHGAGDADSRRLRILSGRALLKPTEGRLSHHTLTEESFDFSKSLAWNVAREWLNEKNVPLILRIFDKFSIIGK